MHYTSHNDCAERQFFCRRGLRASFGWLIGHAKQQQNKQARSREEVKQRKRMLFEDETGLKINPLFTQLQPQFTMVYGIVSVWLDGAQITT